jgi:uncharacterized coiled-coil protein SlyX
MASILKTLAIAAGAGVAIGLCTTSTGRRTTRRDDVIDIEPLLDRLETIERRFETAVTAKPEIENGPSVVTELSRRIEAQDAEIVRLREMVDTRAMEIRSRLEAEMEERHRQALATIEKTVEFRVSERIAAIERSLTEQSVSIEALRDRAQDTDANLQRLIVAIERLCERMPAPLPAAGPVLLPFESHLRDASREAAHEETVPQFRSRIFQEPEPEAERDPRDQKKSRFPLARIFGMIALVVVTQFLR